jgi:hypothetical protein
MKLETEDKGCSRFQTDTYMCISASYTQYIYPKLSWKWMEDEAETVQTKKMEV